MRISINGSELLGRPSIPAIVDHVKAAEADGFDSYWLAQIGLADALTVFGLAGATGVGLELGTAVVPTYSRHPFTLAAQALSAQAMCSRRIVLGIGLSHEPVIRDRYRQEWDPPIAHMREYLAVLTDLLAGAADHTGEMWSFAGEYVPPADPPGIMLAALGPQMLRLAGRRTDGTILWMTGERTIAEHIAPTLNDAAAEAGRAAPRIVCSLPVCVTDEAADVRSAAGVSYARYGELPSYRAMIEREGVSGPAEIALIGNEDEVATRLQRLADAGTTDFAANEMGRNPDEVGRTRELRRSWR